MVGVNYKSHAEVMPEWCAEYLGADRLIPGGTQADVSQFDFSDAQTLAVSSAVTAGSGVSVPLTAALTADIPKGQMIVFGVDETLTLTARALQGATALVGDLTNDLEGDETYAYPGMSGRTVVPEGTVVGRTAAERLANAKYGPVDLANDTDIFLVAFRNDYVEQDAGITLLRHRHMVYEDKIPGWDSFDTAGKDLIRARYDCRLYPS